MKTAGISRLVPYNKWVQTTNKSDYEKAVRGIGPTNPTCQQEFSRGRRTYQVTVQMSVIYPPLYHEDGNCGYCKRTDNGSVTRAPGLKSRIYCFNVRSMPIETYGKLMETGFRRSGKFMYKPDIRNSCCPQYTIRLDANKVVVSKEQRKILRKFNRFACGGECGEKRDWFDLDYEVHLAENTASTTASTVKAKEGKKKKFAPLLYKTCRPNFKVKLLSAHYTAEKFELYKSYQVSVHLDDPDSVTQEGFTRFLCSNPFTKQFPKNRELTLDEVKKGGAIHQVYYYNDKLIALAVLDVLPNQCLSSVYFAWDPDFKEFDLGKVGALREIVLARDLGLPYYYLGLYIHGCVKMRYKGEYKPSELLDPQSLPGHPQWFDLANYQDKLDDREYATMLGEPALPETKMKVVVDETKPSRYFSLQLPGVLTLAEVKKTDFWSSKMMLNLEDPDSDSDSDSEFEGDTTMARTFECSLQQLYRFNPIQALVNVVTELRATIGPLADDFTIIVS